MQALIDSTATWTAWSWLLIAGGFVYAFVMGAMVGWLGAADKRALDRRQAEYASRVITQRDTGERRMYVVRNGRVL